MFAFHPVSFDSPESQKLKFQTTTSTPMPVDPFDEAGNELPLPY